jgi:hypothetical protein
MKYITRGSPKFNLKEPLSDMLEVRGKKVNISKN